MKKLIVAMMAVFFIAGALQAQTAASTGSDKQDANVTVTTVAKVCDGKSCADSDNDGVCDHCKAAFPKAKAASGQAATGKSGCAGEYKSGSGCSKHGQPVQGKGCCNKTATQKKSCCSGK